MDNKNCDKLYVIKMYIVHCTRDRFSNLASDVWLTSLALEVWSNKLKKETFEKERKKKKTFKNGEDQSDNRQVTGVEKVGKGGKDGCCLSK